MAKFCSLYSSSSGNSTYLGMAEAGVLVDVGVSYKKWLRWSWKLFLTEAVVAVVFMMVAVAINYN